MSERQAGYKVSVPVSLQHVSLTALQCSEDAEIKTSLTDTLTYNTYHLQSDNVTN